MLATLEKLSEEVHQRILSCLDASLDTTEKKIYISLKARPRKPKKREGKKLITLEAEVIPETGPCPGGVFHYITDKNKLVRTLRYWSSVKAFVAIDLETGTAWREKIDPETEDVVRYYEDIIDPYTCPIYLVSISVEPGVAVVFDMRLFRDDPEFLEAWREFLVTCRFIAHNSMFEQSFLRTHFGVMCNIVYDTMLVNQLMTAGLES